MSFSGDVKTELCRASLDRPCCASRLPLLLDRAFGLQFDRLPGDGERKYVFHLADKGKIHRIIDAFGFDSRQSPVLHINFGLLEEECCRAAFLRGAFLAGGSVTEPAKGYHLELATSHAQASRELLALLTDMGRQPRHALRNSSQVIYFKNSEQIEELLTLMGAPVSAMELMNAKAEKELRNGVNRRVNCEAANLDKAVDAAQEQLEAIRRLYELDRVEGLNAALKETIVLRETYPELTLSQLAEEFEPPITKSCLNHRMRKLMELSKS